LKKAAIAAIISAAALIITFIFMPEAENDTPEKAVINASTASQRIDYFASHGWEVEELYSKQIIIPSEFNDVYEEYAQIQDKQGLPLRKFAGKNAVLYVYQVKNYSPNGKNMLAELIVCNNSAAASLIYSEDQGSIRMKVQ